MAPRGFDIYFERASWLLPLSCYIVRWLIYVNARCSFSRPSNFDILSSLWWYALTRICRAGRWLDLRDFRWYTYMCTSMHQRDFVIIFANTKNSNFAKGFYWRLRGWWDDVPPWITVKRVHDIICFSFSGLSYRYWRLSWWMLSFHFAASFIFTPTESICSDIKPRFKDAPYKSLLRHFAIYF